jgi:hypothetical protein
VWLVPLVTWGLPSSGIGAGTTWGISRALLAFAIVRPRLSWVWLAPLATWGLLSAGIGAGNGWGSARVLIVFTIVFAVIVHGERQLAAEDESHDHATVRPAPGGRIDPKPSSG